MAVPIGVYNPAIPEIPEIPEIPDEWSAPVGIQDPIRVLVVDDSPTLRSILSGALGAFGLKIVGVAGDGAEALVLFETHKPDAVVMDIMMPVMNGIDSLKKIREIDKDVLVLMITSSEDESYVALAREHGASGFLHKPFKVDELYEDIRTNFRRLLASRSALPDTNEFSLYVMGKSFQERG